MRRLTVGAVALTLVAGALLSVWKPRVGVASATATARGRQDTAQAVPPASRELRVLSEARVVPVREASLSMPIMGIVAEVLVREGERVEAGQALLRIRAGRWEAAVAQAEAAHDVAQAHLDELLRGPLQQEVAIAREEVSAAAAQLQAVKALRDQAQAASWRARASRAAATADLRQAEATVQRLTANEAAVRARHEAALVDVKTARVGVAAAQAELALLSAGPSVQHRVIAELQVDLARNALWGAQSQRDSVGGSVDRMEAKQSDLDGAEAAVGSAHVALSIAEAALEETEADPRPEEIAPIQARVDGARTAVDAAGARVMAAEAQLEGAEAQVALAEAEVEAAKARVDGVAAAVAEAEHRLAAEEAHTEVARARMAQAQAQLELLQAGARAEQIAAAEANAHAAGAELEQALVALAETELRAPFAGTIASLSVKVGEAVVMTEPIVWLADLSAWEIETEDLTEMDVVSIGIGDSALVTLDALPELELVGRVAHIRPLGENWHGDITYKVIVEPLAVDERVRWNMRALVVIQPSDA